MEHTHRQILKRHASLLSGDSGIELTEDFVDGLVSTGIFTKTWISKFTVEESNEKQVNKMLELLPKRGPDAFTLFLEVLGKEYPWLSETLKGQVTDVVLDDVDSAYGSTNSSPISSADNSPQRSRYQSTSSDRGPTSNSDYMLELRSDIQTMTLENVGLKLENESLAKTLATNQSGGSRRHKIKKIQGIVSDLRKEMKKHPEIIGETVYNTFRENEEWDRLRRRTGKSYYKLH